MYSKEEQKEHRKELVAALRSGDYKQTTGCLFDGVGYCCLGVAEKVKGSEFIEDTSKDIWYIPVIDGEDPLLGESALLTEDGQDYFGFSTNDGTFVLTEELINKIAPKLSDRFGFTAANKNSIMIELSILNDTYELSFNQIADIIEAEPEGLIVK